jgi:hypothetical protein
VYVRALQGSSGKWQVSRGGGSYPRWRRDGKEIFYIAPDNGRQRYAAVAGERRGRLAVAI